MQASGGGLFGFSGGLPLLEVRLTPLAQGGCSLPKQCVYSICGLFNFYLVIPPVFPEAIACKIVPGQAIP